MKALKVPSFAKINLGLEVLGTRADGYHELRTLFQTVDLCDTITLTPRPKDLEVVSDDKDLPGGEANLAFRAADELRRFAQVAKGVKIAIAKRIPMGGGLGGGSSNAAAVLLGLNRLWRLGLHPSELHPLARQIGRAHV